MKHPTWKDMSIPGMLVYSIKTLPACYMIDSLVFQLVYRNRRRPLRTYFCNKCGHVHRPERSSEEISGCPKCESLLVHCSVQWRWSREVPSYSRKTGHKFDNIYEAMFHNYVVYFKATPPPNFFDCGWGDNHLYAQFAGGELVTGDSPRLCIAKAAILCPYLWDKEAADQLSPILHTYCNPIWLGA